MSVCMGDNTDIRQALEDELSVRFERASEFKIVFCNVRNILTDTKASCSFGFRVTDSNRDSAMIRVQTEVDTERKLSSYCLIESFLHQRGWTELGHLSGEFLDLSKMPRNDELSASAYLVDFSIEAIDQTLGLLMSGYSNE